MSHRIYAYTHTGYATLPWSRTVGGVTTAGVGLVKVGQTTLPTGLERIRQQTITAYPDFSLINVFFDEISDREDGTWFTDYDVHRALTAQGIVRRGEWFEATIDEVRAAVVSVRNGTPYANNRTVDYKLRPEQERAVEKTATYFLDHENDSQPPRFLWNAKMRFGKTLATYMLAREMGWRKVLVLTYKPVVVNSWRSDLLSHVAFEDWRFYDRNTAIDDIDESHPFVWFTSLQDALGRDVGHNIKAHNLPLHAFDWDAVVIDEYHFGAWRDSAKELYDPSETRLAEAEQDEPLDDNELGITSRFRLYLSGTPFRALANGEFSEDAIFNWTYIDEQREKRDWAHESLDNPYLPLPGVEMFTYVVPAAAEAVAEEGEYNGFDLNAYFKAKKVDSSYVFEDETRVVEFLNMIRGKLTEQMKFSILPGSKPAFPFEDARFNGRLNHTIWYMADVASCFAMAEVLRRHPYFSAFAIHVAAGSDTPGSAAALAPVQSLIDHNAQTITLSCGKLMTGVTVPQWSGILMLRSMKSPESYFQAAFRVQSPWTQRTAAGFETILKDTAYIFDFDPNRALSLLAEYGSKIATLPDEDPKRAMDELINFLPIFAFDGASFDALDASEVFTWATAGTGASMLARRWRDARLVDLTDLALNRLLENEGLVTALEQMEDFRSLTADVQHIITTNRKIRDIKREHEGGHTPESRREQRENNGRRKKLRDKLLKFLARVPVFMYLTDFREEALQDVIRSLDPQLFERVTGLTIADFTALKDAGVFHSGHLNAAIFQFKLFEDASLRYVSDQVGLWDHSVKRSDLDSMSAEEALAAIEGDAIEEEQPVA